MNNKNLSSTKFAITGIGIRPIGKYQHPIIKTQIFYSRLEIHMNIIKTKTRNENALITSVAKLVGTKRLIHQSI